MNQAAVSWHKKDPQTAITLYEKALPFLSPDDYLLNMFLGFNYIFAGNEKRGREILQKIRGVLPDTAVSGDTVIEDFLSGYADADALLAIFSEVDETRASILEKQKKLEEVTKKHPKFRQGFFHLAVTWLQLGREKEALPILEKYIQMHPNDATVNYYLSAIHFQRRNFNQSWKYLKAAEILVKARDHAPKALKDLRAQIQKTCPEPI